MQIKKASRSSVKIKLALTGPSGAGKTMSSLLLAAGLVGNGRILVIDSEDGSSNLYADHELTNGIEFDVLEIEAPYTVQKYIQALELGQKEKYDCIVIDSISHAWAGEGGLLEKKSALDSRGGNSYANWSGITKEQELFKSKMVHCNSHLIVTMRSKQEYVLEDNKEGKKTPRKVGLAPVQREGMEYEFTTVFDIGMDHQFVVSKDRTGLFDGQISKISRSTGEAIRQWQEGKLERDIPKEKVKLDFVKLESMVKDAGVDITRIFDRYKIYNLEELKEDEYNAVFKYLEKMIAQQLGV